MSSVSPANRGEDNNRASRPAQQCAHEDNALDHDGCNCSTCDCSTDGCSTGDCAAGTDAEFDPQEAITVLTKDLAELLESDDPVDAELIGALLLAIVTSASRSPDQALIDYFIPMLEARGTRVAQAMLLAISAVAEGTAGAAAQAAADRLAGAGVIRPKWADELAEPMTVSACSRMSDAAGAAAMLAGSFHRADHSYAVLIGVDQLDSGTVDDMCLLPGEHLSEALAMARADAQANGMEVQTEPLGPAEFRYQVESALAARAVHDRELTEAELSDHLVSDDGPGYLVLATLLRSWLRALPPPTRPGPPHAQCGSHALAALSTLAQLAGSGTSFSGPNGPEKLLDPPTTVPLPSRRDKSDSPAPVYQIKVGLRHAKPPIWRRIEVPADVSLAELHQVIQVAFNWQDTHLHMFETPYGDFGFEDAQLGHRAEEAVTLEQVAPLGEQNKLGYTYDFGDGWEHEILVEKALDRDPTVAYPRCTGGRRAAPPEDCGGIWGYAELLEILADPAHPRHSDMLAWLGLDTAGDFDPNQFDRAAVTQSLTN